MKYGDFSSLVQLGVGLHAGTALLQLYGEIGMQPLMRTLARIRKLVDLKSSVHDELTGELAQVDSAFDIFRIRLFNEYKFFIKINSIVAAALVMLLTVISYKAEDPLGDQLSVVMVAFSVLPAVITLAVLWYNASSAIKPMKERADRLEQRALRARE